MLVREADYGKPNTLAKAFAGATSVLLISPPPASLGSSAYTEILEGLGLPAEVANLIADSDAKAASHGELYTESRDLSRLIGRPTTTLAAAVAAGLPR